MGLTPGTRLGPYEIIVALGAGGMGEVYRARDTRLEREVAVKTLRPASDDERATDRFLREARALATVNHPNVCQVYEIGDAAGLPFIAMELLDGESLAARLERGPLPIADAVDVVLGVLSALQALHRRGVLHRDVKPSNVFLTPYGVKLLDFGLARHADRSIAGTETVLTQPGAIVGTPTYMAPEQLLGGLVDGRTDLFAVGVTLFEMVTARRPFAGDTAMALLHAILHHQPPMLEGSPAIAAIDRVVRRALAKDPGGRFATADEMAEALRAARSTTDAGEAPRMRVATRLAVLPFHVLRPDADVEFLAHGLADAVTTALSGIDALTVRSSVLSARVANDASDLKKVGATLDVDVVLTGTLLRGGDRIRVTAQLLEVSDGKVLWSRTSQVAAADLLTLEPDLVDAVREGLQIDGVRERLFGSGAAPRVRAVAVLPLENLSGDASQEFFADGMTEALITDLARLGGLKRVIGRGSVMRYKRTEKAPAEIARELKVDALVTGAVLRSGDRMRVTVQLIDPATEESMWAERYDRDIRDVLRLQNEILGSIARQIKLTLTGEDDARLAAARPVDPEVFEACLKGRFHLLKLSPENREIAREYFQQALAKDPEYAPAHSGMGSILLVGAHMGFTPVSEVLEAGKAHVMRALELDESNGEVHMRIGTMKCLMEWDWDGAERALQRAFELNPGVAEAHLNYADLLLMKRQRDAARAHLERALELDPLNFWIQMGIGGRFLRLGLHERGVALLEKSLRAEPDVALTHQYLWTAYDRQRQFDRAFSEARKFLDLRGHHEAVETATHTYEHDGYAAAMRSVADALAARSTLVYVQPTQVAAPYAFAGDADRAFEWLERGYTGRDTWMAFLIDDPRFESLRSDPRMDDLIRRMNFPQ